jgi:hypothetical protein
MGYVALQHEMNYRDDSGQNEQFVALQQSLEVWL